MSILDVDATERRDPAHVRTKEFAQVRRGYDPDQVRRYLRTVATWMDDLETDLAEARAAAGSGGAEQAEVRESREDLYAALGVRVAEVLRTAEGVAEQVTRETQETAQRLLDEARAEALSLRHRAQEEAEAMRQSAQEQSETLQRTAQEEADRAREEAAGALENARIEAERTITSLSERRTVLAAELHATKSRLMGIVTQLEEKAEEESHVQSELRKAWTPEAASGSVPPDDPRRDPQSAPDIPAFIPPPAPPRTFRGRSNQVPAPAAAGIPSVRASSSPPVDPVSDAAAVEVHGLHRPELLERPGEVHEPHARRPPGRRPSTTTSRSVSFAVTARAGIIEG